MCDPLELFYAWDMMYEYSKCFDHQTTNLVTNSFFQLFHEDRPHLAISASTTCLHVRLLFFVRNLALMQSFLAFVKDIDFDKWSILPGGTTIIAKNTPYIPSQVSDDELPFPRADGSWGPHEISLLPQAYDSEHPYLSHILVDAHDCFRLPRSVTCHRFKDADFYRYPSLPRRGYIKGTVVNAWKDEIYSYQRCVLRLYKELQSTSPGPYNAPTIAIGRAEDTLFVITHNIMSYRDAVEYTRGLQRFVAEIQAFLVWGNRILGRSLQEAPTTRQCFRGAYITSSTDFKYLSSLGVPVFYLTRLSPSELPPSRYVRITELPSLCELRTWTDINVTRHQRDVIKGRLLHSKPLMFYPPHVDHSDPLAFERAARGYGPRNDTRIFDRRLLIDSAIVAGGGEFLNSCSLLFY